MNIEELAKLLYTDYRAAVGGKAFNGDPLPDWETFCADPNKKVQSEAWKTIADSALIAIRWNAEIDSEHV